MTETSDFLLSRFLNLTHFFSPLDGNLQWKNESTSQLGKIRFKASRMRLYVLQHAHQAMKNSGATDEPVRHNDKY